MIDIQKLFADLGLPPVATRHEPVDLLRRDLSDAEYADWFLGEKINRGQLDQAHFLNDFVLFRVAFDWPRGGDWTPSVAVVTEADFSLDDLQARDLVDMAREGLTDGFTPAAWWAKLAAMWYVAKEMKMPEILFEYLQEIIFMPPMAGSGRKKKDGIDRDRVVRNLYEGILARNLGHAALVTHSRSIVAQALNRHGLPVTDDAVRKICERAERSNREKRYWHLLTYGRSLER